MQDLLTYAATASLFSIIGFIAITFPIYVWQRSGAPCSRPTVQQPPALPVVPALENCENIPSRESDPKIPTPPAHQQTAAPTLAIVAVCEPASPADATVVALADPLAKPKRKRGRPKKVA